MTTLGLPYVGIIPRPVPANSKCTYCFHYDSGEGTSGACQMGLQPVTCGDGLFPRSGYAPVTGTLADGQVADPREPSNALFVEHLTDEQVGLVKSIVDNMVGEVRKSCPLHSRPASFTSVAAARNVSVMLDCECRTLDPRQVTKSFWEKLNHRQRAGTTPEEAQEFVAKAMSRVYAPPSASKRPPTTYLPGVHDPNHPLRPKRGRSGARREDRSSASTSKALDGLAELEEIVSKAWGRDPGSTFHGGRPTRNFDTGGGPRKYSTHDVGHGTYHHHSGANRYAIYYTPKGGEKASAHHVFTGSSAKAALEAKEKHHALQLTRGPE